MSRYKMVATPQRLPGHCMTCGSGECREGFVDTELELDGFGAVQICYRCIRGMSEAFGIDAMARNIITDDAVAQVQALTQQLENLQDGITDSLGSLGTRVGNLANHFAKCERLLTTAVEERTRSASSGTSRKSHGKNGTTESSGLDKLGANDDSTVDF